MQVLSIKDEVVGVIIIVIVIQFMFEDGAMLSFIISYSILMKLEILELVTTMLVY